MPGIEPTSESFNDKGFGPPPAKWKGRCGPYTNFSGCNNKLIGAKYFNLEGAPVPGDVLSPTDVQGHGTHTASTVAGAAVPGANLYSLASGTARGAVPSARVAAYKVCWLGLGCSDMDLLAAFDAAIADGVDVISVSIGGSSSDFFTDTISIGAFHAMKRGIMTVCSAGNSGPSAGTVQNYAPWIFTVAASATDRQFRSQISLGNGMKLTGIGINTFTPAKTAYPLVTGDEIAKPDASLAEFCSGDALDPEKAKGKIVYCKALEPGVSESIQMVGGEGFILETTQYLDTAAAYSLPGTVVSPRQGKIIAEYLNSTRNATVEISKSVAANIKAPFVATFSSRGPGPSSLRFIKPDIAAPGVDILAAYSTLTSMTGTSGDTRVVKFMMMSGTSMACPHVSGVAAYVKSFHPTWSPAMIKSAIMTTATPMSSQNDKEAEMAYGSGQLNPVKALNPGLVYDTDEHGYMSFLCSQGYMESNSLKIITGNKSINCADFPKAMGFDDLNYPSMFMTVPPADNKTSQPQPTTAIFVRKLTNVGPPQSEYSAKVECPPDVSVTVQPPHFSFNHTHQKFSFMVIVKAKPSFNDYIRSAALIWSDSVRTVRSPIVIM
ncbi:Subtilisin-like protease SBT4-14 [Nymphaea thermarum]|nr:Subtilisin-like protease SBT4-14 [Nymphaea thermarum]